MDSPFNRQYSLYDSVTSRPFGSTSSLNSAAGKPLSRIGSPAVTTSALNSDPAWQTNSPKPDASSLGQPPASAGWSNPASAGRKDSDASTGQIGSNSTDRIGGFNAFVSPSTTGFPGFGYSLGNSSSMMGYPSYTGAPNYGGVTGQYGSQYSNQQPMIGQLGSHAYGQYASPYATTTYDASRDEKPLDTAMSGNVEALKTGIASGSATNLGSIEGSRSGSIVASPPTASLDEAVIPPASIYWHYVDLQGQVQGPFSGVQMNEWLAYMLDVTLVRRVNDTIFVSFGILKEVTGSLEPFIVLLSAKAWSSVMRKAAEQMQAQTKLHLERGAAPVSEQVPDEEMQPREPKEKSVVPSIPTDAQNQEMAKLYDPSMTPVDANSQTVRRESSLAPGDIVASLASVKISDNAQKSQKQQQEQQGALQQTQQQQESIIISDRDSSPLGSKKEADKQVAAPRVPSSPLKSQAKPADTPVHDPWKKTPKPTAQVNITELKQQESAKQQQQKKKGVESSNTSTPTRKAPQSRWLPIDQLQQQSTENGTSEPTTPTWSKKTVGPTRSLADIQKEQAMKNKQAPTVPIQPSTNTDINLGGVKSLPPKTAATPQRLETTPKARPQSVAESPRATRLAAATPVSKPRSQRTVTQQNVGTTSVTSAASMAKPTDELVHWARVSFKDLNRGIDPMELLDVFLSLPSGNSAKEFIAESIYSYSKTLDGRRFASDFISRKKTAENSMAPGETWKDVMNRFNPINVEQDPSFKVVTKKRTQKIARPDSMHI